MYEIMSLKIELQMSTLAPSQVCSGFHIPDIFSWPILRLEGGNQKRAKRKFSMAPIRIGFLGLSKTGWATTAHIPYLSTSPKFKIVAICNSSMQSAREAVDLYKLPADTATYGDPEGLDLLFSLIP
jgi:hypothetical protein